MDSPGERAMEGTNPHPLLPPEEKGQKTGPCQGQGSLPSPLTALGVTGARPAETIREDTRGEEQIQIFCETSEVSVISV